MIVIGNVDELIRIIKLEEDIILYGAGAVARDLVDYIEMCGLIDRVSCIAVQKKENNPAQIGSLSVIKLDCLGHYKETGCFVVATMNDKYAEIEECLIQFGCKKIIGISEAVIRFIQNNEIKSSIKDYQYNKQFDMLIERLDDLEWRVEEQAELCSVHKKTFETHKNSNFGKDVVIVATGPSMIKYNPLPGAIHIGVNGAWKREDVKLDYYFVQDGSREKLCVTAEGLNSGRIKCPVFLGSYLKRLRLDACMTFPEEYYSMENVNKYYSDSFPNGRNRSRDIYRDICFHPLADFSSIVFPALHFALYTYPRRIYLVGCDCSGTRYFYDTNAKSGIQNDLRWVKRGYARMKDFADYAYPQTHIVSLNPVGLKGLFDDEYTE